ncbi:o-succinylbenzoate synthase [Metabacillus herbersteinensis]|uniref:o-succinylbenzoate synthase n=1 Tax=Metabacillus herbersteinensis TaxID=283816 RepID=A0ABV6GJY5_9BACI
MIEIQKVVLHHLDLIMKNPFHTSIGTVHKRESIIVEMIDCEGIVGWGEVVAFSSPWYTEETIQTCLHMLRDYYIPYLLRTSFTHPEDIAPFFLQFKRNHMAKASLEGALWDLYAKKEQKPLSKVLGGTRQEIEAGVVVGMGSLPSMIQQIERFMDEGYKRYKIKIDPSNDIEIVEGIRNKYPDLPLMADANSTYTLGSLSRLQELDRFQLLMIEQPLSADDIIDHATLQKKLKTPICLDESIVTIEDARKAIQLGSCKIINIKPGRVGGLAEAKKIHDLCLKNNIAVWCGGMLETGVSRAHNIALASLPNFVIPGDISSSSRHWHEDIVDPQIEVKNGKIQVPTGDGIGFSIDRKALRKFRTTTLIFKK